MQKKLENRLRQYLTKTDNLKIHKQNRSIQKNSDLVLFVFLWNDDVELVKHLVQRRIVKMVIAGGLQEVFRVFETLLLPVDTVASLLANHKNKDQIKNNIQDCIKEGENAKYGVLNAIVYKELFSFCRVVADRFIDQ